MSQVSRVNDVETSPRRRAEMKIFESSAINIEHLQHLCANNIRRTNYFGPFHTTDDSTCTLCHGCLGYCSTIDAVPVTIPTLEILQTFTQTEKAREDRAFGAKAVQYMRSGAKGALKTVYSRSRSQQSKLQSVNSDKHLIWFHPECVKCSICGRRGREIPYFIDTIDPAAPGRLNNTGVVTVVCFGCFGGTVQHDVKCDLSLLKLDPPRIALNRRILHNTEDANNSPKAIEARKGRGRSVSPGAHEVLAGLNTASMATMSRKSIVDVRAIPGRALEDVQRQSVVLLEDPNVRVVGVQPSTKVTVLAVNEELDKAGNSDVSTSPREIQAIMDGGKSPRSIEAIKTQKLIQGTTPSPRRNRATSIAENLFERKTIMNRPDQQQE